MGAQALQRLIEAHPLHYAARHLRLVHRLGGGEKHGLHDALGFAQRDLVTGHGLVAVDVEEFDFFRRLRQCASSS